MCFLKIKDVRKYSYINNVFTEKNDTLMIEKETFK